MTHLQPDGSRSETAADDTHRCYPALLMLLTAALVNAWIAPPTHPTADTFLATFAWSLGVAASTYLFLRSRTGLFGGYPTLVLSLVGTSYVSMQIGMGAYSTPRLDAGVADELTAFAHAVASWGLLGAVLGGAAGVLAGRYAFHCSAAL